MLDSTNSRTNVLYVLCYRLIIYGALTGSVHIGIRHIIIIIHKTCIMFLMMVNRDRDRKYTAGDTPMVITC